MEIQKSILSLAGEYAVASELCRRGMYAQLTFGNQKRTDILVFNPETDKMVKIEVKSKRKNDFPNCKGIKGANSFLVLVDFKDKAINEKPDFYILSEKDWLDFVHSEIGRMTNRGLIEIDGENCPIWRNQISKKTGQPYKGMGIKPSRVEILRDWSIIENALR